MDYKSKSVELGELIESKQKQYGDAFGRAGAVFALLYPEGVRPDQMTDALGMLRVLDKLFRIAQRGESGQDLGGESPWKDIAGYGLLGWARDEPSFEAWKKLPKKRPQEGDSDA